MHRIFGVFKVCRRLVRTSLVIRKHCRTTKSVNLFISQISGLLFADVFMDVMNNTARDVKRFK